MLNYQTITALVNQIPAGTWDVLGEIKGRRPAMMLSELIECRRRALQEQGPSEPRSQTARPSDTPSLCHCGGSIGHIQPVRMREEAATAVRSETLRTCLKSPDVNP